MFYLLQLETDLRQSDIIFESDADASAIADTLAHASRCTVETVTRTALYPVSIGRLDRETGLFGTVIGDCLYDSDLDGDEALDVVQAVEWSEHVVVGPVS